MEFFAEITDCSPSAERIYDVISIPRLPNLCASIDSVVSIESQGKGEVYCIWGQFEVSRERIQNGVRMALLNCPHALAWTVAAKSGEGKVVIHCTIDDKEAEHEFVETIEQFVLDWAQGLKIALSENA